MLKKYLAFLLFLVFGVTGLAQEKASLYGYLKNEKGKAVEYANIALKDYKTGTSGSFDGYYLIEVPAGVELTILFSCIGYEKDSIQIKLQAGEKRKLDFTLKSRKEWLKTVTIRDEHERAKNITRIDPKIISIIPNTGGSFETVLKTLPGVVSNNELSSQYSVRGGNFDENLVYVNDIEVYRPFLIRSGQQEGLSFINPDMVSSVLFSAGGFEARYGDKMSSVLDIKYKEPKETAASASLSLLGASAHLEGSSKNYRLTHITGFRYKSNSYLLGSLDEQGDYKPSFLDFQTFLTYDLSTRFKLNFLGHFARNNYLFIPETRETSFGTIHEALKLKIYFDGQEVNRYTTFTGALAGHYHPKKNLKLSVFASMFNTREEETFDILGQYFLNELDNQLGSDNIGDSLMNIGVGSFLNHARNELDATVMSAYHKGTYTNRNHVMQWGAKFSHEIFNDYVNEWRFMDSAGYSLPYSDQIVNLYESLHGDTAFQSNRVKLYWQDAYSFTIDSAEISLTGGLRLSYWDFNQEVLLSPRFNLAFKPNWEHDFLFRLATGVYYQEPFFREMKGLNGKINKDIKAQRSIHFVLGSDYNFMAWNRPFKFVTELYYKALDNLIPYDIDNVRVRYYGQNISSGYATGIDFKVNGEFVPGVDSWASLSLMSTREKVEGSFYGTGGDTLITISGNGYIPRPGDQFFTFGLFFQDYLPGNPSYKMQLNLVYGSGLPFGPPNSYKTIADLRIPAYRRVDIGFSKLIKSEDRILHHGFLKGVNTIWIGLEVFNLLDIKNTVSYIWITDIRNQQYAVPNYLTSRRINLKMIVTI